LAVAFREGRKKLVSSSNLLFVFADEAHETLARLNRPRARLGQRLPQLALQRSGLAPSVAEFSICLISSIWNPATWRLAHDLVPNASDIRIYWPRRMEPIPVTVYAYDKGTLTEALIMELFYEIDENGKIKKILDLASGSLRES
jgi:hypothetical protein